MGEKFWNRLLKDRGREVKKAIFALYSLAGATALALGIRWGLFDYIAETDSTYISWVILSLFVTSSHNSCWLRRINTNRRSGDVAICFILCLVGLFPVAIRLMPIPEQEGSALIWLSESTDHPSNPPKHGQRQYTHPQCYVRMMSLGLVGPRSPKTI